jgi:2-polyprenyl-3-methyl-5-hydroxy-6-metoxy-1,4-benzoquinol methylase
MDKVLSPVTESEAIHLRDYSTLDLIARYSRSYNIDVSGYFDGLSDISLYKCRDTGYQFFYPASCGDSAFYEQLQLFEWYYDPWKWEHQKAYTQIVPQSRVLEIGCAEGNFLEKIKTEKDCEVLGIEYNKNAISICNQKGISVSTFDQLHPQEQQAFDYICSFQVLEHLPDVKEFFENIKKLIINKGKVILSVPNNESFIKNIEGGTLNFPPHHTGWWSNDSLKRTLLYYGFSNVSFYNEPLQEYHFEWYIKSKLINTRLGQNIFYFLKKSNLILLLKYLMKPFFRFIDGHTVLLVASRE